MERERWHNYNYLLEVPVAQFCMFSYEVGDICEVYLCLSPSRLYEMFMMRTKTTNFNYGSENISIFIDSISR